MSLLWALRQACVRPTIHIFIKRAVRQLSPFLSPYTNMFPTPTALRDIVVTNVMLLLRNGVLGSTDPSHSPISLCFLKAYRAALCPLVHSNDGL